MANVRLRSLAIIGSSVLILSGLNGCASDNSPQPQPMPLVTNEATLTLGWSKHLGAGQAGSFIPVNFDNAIFAAAGDGQVYKIDPSDGSIISHFKLRRKLSSGVAVTGATIFVTTMDAQLLAIDKGNGKIRWQAQLPTLALEAPQTAADLVVVRTNDAELLAFNVADGAAAWIYQKPIPALTLRTRNTFQVVGNDVVAAGLPGGKLALLNLRTGVPIWENYIAIPEGATDLDKITDIAMRPVIDNKMLCVASYNGKIACLDAISSNIMWEKNFSSSRGLVIDQQNVYAVSQDGVVDAYDKASGGQVWQNITLQYRNLGIPALLGNGIILSDSDGWIHMFNRNDGHEMARIASKLYAGTSYPLVRDNGVVFQAANGYLALIKNY